MKRSLKVQRIEHRNLENNALIGVGLILPFLREMAKKEFGREFDRGVFRRFASSRGYDHVLPEEREEGPISA